MHLWEDVAAGQPVVNTDRDAVGDKRWGNDDRGCDRVK